MNESRIKKSLLNAKVNFLFYFIILIMSFISRKIFLNTLGVDFMGLTGTLSNILGMLNLAELGIGTSISFHLYKPIKDENLKEINDLISLFGWFYRIIGCIILIIAVIVSLFFPVMFNKTGISLGLIYFVFYSFLLSSLIGYFINYRQLLLTADQRGYVVTVYLQSATVVKYIIQIICCLYFLNYYLWAIIELLFSFIACIILNNKINKTYPWLISKPKKGRILNKNYPSILDSVKKIFIHRIKDFLLNQSDQILIFAFVSLKYVTYYGNYSMIILKVISLFSTIMGSAEASIGNLVAENNKDKEMKIFWELMSMRYLCAGIISVSLYFIIPPFIEVWLGKEFLLSNIILFLMCLNMFIMMTRTVIDTFNHSFGQYADVWAAWAELGINIITTIIVASKYGIIGILMGKILSLLLIVVIWKPMYLFKDGFHESYISYWKNTSIYYLWLFISIIIVILLRKVCPFEANSSWTSLILYSLYMAIAITIVYGSLMYLFSNGLKGFIFKMISYYKNK